MKTHVCSTVNGEPVEFLCEPQETLLDVLRAKSFARMVELAAKGNAESAYPRGPATNQSDLSTGRSPSRGVFSVQEERPTPSTSRPANTIVIRWGRVGAARGIRKRRCPVCSLSASAGTGVVGTPSTVTRTSR